MIERILFSALSTGIQEITDEPRKLETIFQTMNPTFCLSEEEAARIRAIWEDRPLKVYHGYPHGNSEFPAVFITLTGEREDTHFLGEEVGQVLDCEDPDRGAFIHGAIWAHQFTLLVISQSPDVTIYFYHLVKWILNSQDAFLKCAGIMEAHLSGADMAPDQSWMPAGFYARRMTLDLKTEYNQVVPDEVNRAWSLRGVHWNPTDTPEEFGEAHAHVSTYGTGEE